MKMTYQRARTASHNTYVGRFVSVRVVRVRVGFARDESTPHRPTSPPQVLKRRTIKSRLSPLGVLSSFISDFDLISDWLFLEFVLVRFPLYLQRAGLTFAIIGTVMWALATTEFALLSTIRVMWKGNPAARLEHVGLGWQLLANIFLEDLPQFMITIITNPNSVAGVLNIVLTTFSLMSKLIHGFSSTR